jgi:hypothetical protein
MSENIQEQDHEKSCLCCKYLEIYFGVSDYSDVTPGDGAHLGCDKGHYGITTVYAHSYEDEPSRLLDTAKTCADFKHR